PGRDPRRVPRRDRHLRDVEARRLRRRRLGFERRVLPHPLRGPERPRGQARPDQGARQQARHREGPEALRQHAHGLQQRGLRRVSAPVQLLRGARAFARDFPRDNMTAGYLWDIADFVPTLIDTQLTGRGAWLWGSAVQSNGDYFGGCLAPFVAGEQNLGGTANGTLYSIGLTPPFDVTSRGTVPVGIQNPVQLFDQ